MPELGAHAPRHPRTHAGRADCRSKQKRLRALGLRAFRSLSSRFRVAIVIDNDIETVRSQRDCPGPAIPVEAPVTNATGLF
jgi:hypothetical protein